MFKKQIIALFGAMLVLMGVSVAQATDTNPTAAATTVTAVTDPVFVFNQTTQAVNAQFPAGATVLALVLVPDNGRACGNLTNGGTTTPFVGTCITYVGLVSPPSFNMVDTIAAAGGWAKSVSIWVLLADGTTWSKQVSLPVKAYVEPPKKTVEEVMQLLAP